MKYFHIKGYWPIAWKQEDVIYWFDACEKTIVTGFPAITLEPISIESLLFYIKRVDTMPSYNKQKGLQIAREALLELLGE